MIGDDLDVLRSRSRLSARNRCSERRGARRVYTAAHLHASRESLRLRGVHA